MRALRLLARRSQRRALERLREMTAAHNQRPGRDFLLSLSIGLSAIPPGRSVTLEELIAKYPKSDAGTRARQAQSRAKKLEKMERVTRDPRDGKALGFAFKPPERTGRVVFEIEGGELPVGGRLENEVELADRLGDGVGK